MQLEITKRSDLLNKDGKLYQQGWAKDLILRYSRNSIKASRIRIKEWDYYCILSHDYGIAFTIADNGYMGFASATIFHFIEREDITKSIITPFPMGKFKMPETSKEGDIKFFNNKITIEFIKDKDCRSLYINCPNFSNHKPLEGVIKLMQIETMDTMVIATPFAEDRHAFYYNQKINCMPAEGIIRFGNDKLVFEPSSSFGVLDWGRGVWTYSNTWYWGSASGVIDGILFGFNIGYGFGDTSKASENMIFYDNKAHKLDQVIFHIPEDNFLKPWTFTSDDGRFEMDFEPIIDRNSNSNLFLIKSVQHQVFGYFTGKVILNDGKEVYIKKFLGFAEKVTNKW